MECRGMFWNVSGDCIPGTAFHGILSASFGISNLRAPMGRCRGYAEGIRQDADRDCCPVGGRLLV